MSSICRECGQPLTSDDIGATLRFLDRTAKEYLCLLCLSKEFDCSLDFLKERIVFLKDHGCTAFPDSKRRK